MTKTLTTTKTDKARLHAAEVHRRLMGPPRVNNISRIVKKPVEPIVAPIFVEEKPKPKLIWVQPPRAIIDERHHVDTWIFWKTSPLKFYLSTRAAELGTSLEAVLGTNRKRDINEIRQMLMYEIKHKVRKKITWLELGRLFSRDHSTVMHGVRRHKNMLKSKAQTAILDDPLDMLRMIAKGCKLPKGYEAVQIKDSLKTRGAVAFKRENWKWVITSKGQAIIKEFESRETKSLETPSELG